MPPPPPAGARGGSQFYRKLVRPSKTESVAEYIPYSRIAKRSPVIEVAYNKTERAWDPRERMTSAEKALQAADSVSQSVVVGSEAVVSPRVSQTWDTLRALREPQEGLPAPASERERDEAFAEYAEEGQLRHRKEEEHVYRNAQPFVGGLLADTFDTVEYGERASCVINMSPSDVLIAEVLKESSGAESAEEGGAADAAEAASDGNYIRVFVEYEGMNTWAMMCAFSRHLDLPLGSLRVVSSTLNTDVTVAQTLEVKVESRPHLSGGVESEDRRLQRLLTVLTQVRTTVKGNSVVDAANPDVMALMSEETVPLPFHPTFYNSAQGDRNGIAIVRSFAKARDPLHTTDVASFETNLLLRDVRGGTPEVTETRLNSLRRIGALNTIRTPECATRDGSGWVKTGAAALNGNYRMAVSSLLDQISALDRDAAAFMDQLMALTSKAKVRTKKATRRGENRQSDLEAYDETDLLISSSDVNSLLEKLPVELTWVGHVMVAILTDDGMSRFRRIWRDVVPPHITRAVQRAPIDFLWNRMAVERLRRYGPDPVKGDLIRTPLGSVKLIETHDEAGLAQRSSIVLPYPQISRGGLWNQNLRFPRAGVTQAAYEVCMRNCGLAPQNLHPQDAFADPSWESYRPLFIRPSAVEIGSIGQPGSADGGEGVPRGQTSGLSEPIMVSDVSIAAWNQRQSNAKVPPPRNQGGKDPREDSTAHRDMRQRCLQEGVVLSRRQWSQLLLRQVDAAPAPPSEYAQAWECASCDQLNHPGISECASCRSVGRKEYVEEDVEGFTLRPGEAADCQHLKLRLVTAPHAHIESVLSEALALHSWHAYTDPGSRHMRHLATLSSLAS